MSVIAATNRRLVSLGFFLLICLAASTAGGLTTYPNIGDWYQDLQKPEWTPPADAFGPIWTVLYTMLAVSAWLVWDRLHGEAFPALKLFGYLLGLNVLWSILFFALRSPYLAAFQIVIAWVVTGVATFAFQKIHRVAGWLMAVYWAWISFATAFNIAIARSN